MCKKLKCFRTILTNHNYFCKEIENRPNFRKATTTQFRIFCVPSATWKVNIKILIIYLLFYRCLRSGCLEEYLGKIEKNWQETEESYKMSSFTICTLLQQIKLGRSNQGGEADWACRSEGGIEIWLRDFG
jgi:hypothetical protein